MARRPCSCLYRFLPLNVRIIARNSRYKYRHIVVNSVYVIINGSLNVELAMIAELA